MFLVSRAMKLTSALPRALLMPQGTCPAPNPASAEFPDGQSTIKWPSPFGLNARYCVYGRADAAVNDGEKSMSYGSLNTPATFTRCRSSNDVGPYSQGASYKPAAGRGNLRVDSERVVAVADPLVAAGPAERVVHLEAGRRRGAVLEVRGDSSCRDLFTDAITLTGPRR
jgi:hypothetical protein